MDICKAKPFGDCSNNNDFQIFRNQFQDISNTNVSKFQEFLNSLFKNLDSMSTGFRMAAEELKENSNNLFELHKIRARCSITFDYTIKLCKILEILCFSTTKALYNDEFNIIRICEFAICILSLTPNISLISESEAYSANKYQLFAPIAGCFISLSLYEEKHNNYLNSNSIYKILPKISDISTFSKTFQALSNFSWKNEKSAKINDDDLYKIDFFVNKLQSSFEFEQNNIDDDADDDDLCNICYANPANTFFVPCKHTSCKQ